MAVSVDCFGFNMNQADSLTRKILSKKKKDKMEMLRRMMIFGKKNCQGPEDWEENPNLPWYDPNGEHYGDEICGGLAKGYTLDELEKFNTDIQGYSSYLFNKSHSASYSYLSIITAYLKCYYPVEYLASVLSIQAEDKIERYVQVCENEGIQVLTPDINVSGKNFTADPKNRTIYYGLASIKGVGESVLDEIINNRPYMGLEEVFEKLPKRLLNKRVILALAKSGALDTFDIDRNRFAIINRIHEIRKDKDYEILDEENYNSEACIKFETEVLSAPITYKPWWTQVAEGEVINEEAQIVSFREQMDRKGKLMCFAKLSINGCEIETVIFASTYRKCVGAFDSNLNPLGTINVIGSKDDKGKLIVKSVKMDKENIAKKLPPAIDF